ncbi:ribbon-helix-helix protein, CopG family [bacterium]|nr:MAG: ribbon-helix-helix protein, CopG family [bacterium]
MSQLMEESSMARPSEEPGKKKEGISVTLPPDIHERVMALKATTGQSASKIIAAALRKTLDDFEKDPGEMLRP